MSKNVSVGTSNPNSTFEVQGSVGKKVNYTTDCSNEDATESYSYYVNLTGCSGGKDIDLPSISNAEDRIYVFKRLDNQTDAANSLTIDPVTGDTIEGYPDLDLNVNGNRVMIQAVPETGRWEIMQYSGPDSTLGT